MALHHGVIALAGNPNVGKSTVFNALTGLRQHTGNWPGKTVACARGTATYNGQSYLLVDLPGCYSLMAHSEEEEIARDFLCFEKPDAIVVVCDAVCLERNIGLVLQAMEISRRVVVCVNLMDEARKKGIAINLPLLSERLGVPVVGTSARSKRGLDALMRAVESVCDGVGETKPCAITYPSAIESEIERLMPLAARISGGAVDERWLALRLLDNDASLREALRVHLGVDIGEDAPIPPEPFQDDIVKSQARGAEAACEGVARFDCATYNRRDRRIDRFLTSKWTGFPVMFLLLVVIFWITIAGANYPSDKIAEGFHWLEVRMLSAAQAARIPQVVSDMLILGVYRVLSWVVSVMLPPMAIFFPLFTLLEDLGYLPRVAFNLDKLYKRCHACGKQALTMCMGFGCNAVGVSCCRIIDSPREQLIAMLTNNFVPCNGRFPLLIAMLGMFFAGGSAGLLSSALPAILLASVILFGIAMTFAASKLLSLTLLKGVPSSFTLELPPYRRPQIGKVIIRSVLDRTLFVLGRAAMVAAPAGFILWCMANVTLGGATLLAHCAGFLDPLGRLLGMDGVILLAFILGMPANEIVLPIIIMAYAARGSLVSMESLGALKQLLVENGWTAVTAVCVMLFSLMHWPCATTLLTILKESRSVKWTALSFAVPTLFGVGVCYLFATVAKALGIG